MARPVILCVDDEPTVLVSLKEQLRRRFGRELSIETAESGEAALEILDELRAEGTVVPVIVTDHIMPGLKGDELLERVEARDPEIMKIMLTGQATAEAVGNAVNRGNLYRYLSKPWAEPDLGLTVKSAIETFEARRRIAVHQSTLQDLNGMALDLTASLATRDRYQRLVTRLSRALGASCVALFVLRGQALVRLATLGGDEGDVPRVLKPSPGGPIEEALVAEAIVRCAATRDGCALAEALGWAPLRGGALALALREDGGVAGLLAIGTDAPLASLTDDRVGGFAALAGASLRTAGLVDAIEAAHEQQRQLAGVLLRQADSRTAGPMHGTSSLIRQTLSTLDRAAKDDAPLIVIGLPGTGHEAAARHLHRSSARADGPFLTIQGVAIQHPGVLGLDDDRSMLRLAHGGTLFIGGADRLISAAQLELLHSLERLDGDEPDLPSVRLVLSTSAMDERSLRGALEPALLERLKWRVILPSLRERLEDIPALVQFYLRAHAMRLGRQVDDLPDRALDLLAAYPWPGNVEELERVIERAVLTARGRVAAVDRGLLDATQAVGSYRLLELIGAGGMGEVWRAQHEHLVRPAAVKLIKASRLWSKEAMDETTRRFRREASATARLRSPHTVELYDFGINDNGDLYYVMELLEGIDLQTLVSEHGPMAAARVTRLLAQACHSLMEAHEAGMVHRDIKPANLFLCRRHGPDHDVLKVLDFGMVTAGAIEDDEALTQPGSITGTASTMAPEVLKDATDHRSDLYSLGCTAYFLLTGGNVFSSRIPTIFVDHMSTPPKPPSSVTDRPIPAALEALVLALLAKDPGDRPQSARELRGVLLALEHELGEPWTEALAAAWWADPTRSPSSSPPLDPTLDPTQGV